MPEISIADTKKVINAIKIRHKADFSCFSITQLRYKLDRILKVNQYLNTGELIESIHSEEPFFEKLTFDLFNTQSELFRDPELWIYLKNIVLFQLKDLFPKFKILIPAFSNSSELISLLIFLGENELIGRSDIYISLMTKYSPPDIFNFETDITMRSIDLENINKVFPEIDLEKYFTIQSNTMKINSTLYAKVFEIEQNLDFKIQDEKFNLILFRNQLLSFSLNHQNKIIENLVSGLDKNGMIVFGYRENISSFIHSSDKIDAIDIKENIFKKK